MVKKTLHKTLAAYGFNPKQRTTGLWQHESRQIQLALVLDDFGVEYERKKDMNYLLDALNSHYEEVVDNW